eukprot:TRINITY_DN4858_c0_g1_i2.p1 TRINITY_DN4858_c0_g1~~TRINITY_DN4858_c0_g1_i2.p1  ORF type:complete len:336 (-),score=75.11 TRINITY_DN4858_c0_g1_i2:68-1036(-)
MIPGGVAPARPVTAADLGVWQQAVAKDPSLAALGQPNAVETQVVAGTNYTFTFPSGARVKIFHQPWTNTLQVTEKVLPSVTPQSPVQSLQPPGAPIGGPMMPGAPMPSRPVTAEDLGVWQQAVAKDPSLAALGQPNAVETQVVAGTNYTFTFPSGARVKIFHQPWTNTLQVTEKVLPSVTPQSPVQSLQPGMTYPTPQPIYQSLQPPGAPIGGPMMPGAPMPSRPVTAEDLGVWQQAVAKDPSLAALGQPNAVQTQVVAGVNYTFMFPNGDSVKIFHQAWTNTLEVMDKPSKVEDPSEKRDISAGSKSKIKSKKKKHSSVCC